MISLHNAISKIYNTKWSLNSNFAIQFTGTAGGLWEKTFGNVDFNLYMKNFELPQYGSSELIEEFINDRYRMAQGIYDVTSVQVTFKDFDNFSLYRKFLGYLVESKNKYFDEISFSIDIFKLPDHPGQTEMKMATIEKCALKFVSKITLDNENGGQIGEFDINIKSAKVPTMYT